MNDRDMLALIVDMHNMIVRQYKFIGSLPITAEGDELNREASKLLCRIDGEDEIVYYDAQIKPNPFRS